MTADYIDGQLQQMILESMARVRGVGSQASDKDILLAALGTFVGATKANGEKLDIVNEQLGQLVSAIHPPQQRGREIVFKVGTPFAAGGGLVGIIITILDRVLK